MTESHGGNPESILIPQETSFSLEAAIDRLHNATRGCLDHLVDQDASAAADIADAAVLVLNRLVVLAVHDAWVEEMTRGAKPGMHFQQLSGVTHIQLPVETEAGAEVIDARLSGRHAAFELSHDGVEALGRSRIRLGNIELGLDPRDVLSEMQKLVWNTVFKESQRSRRLTPTEEKNLKETLEHLYKHGKSYYLLLHPEREGWGVDRATLLQLLRREFPYLGAFLIGAGTHEPVLVLSDVRLMVLIREFLRMCQEYR